MQPLVERKRFLIWYGLYFALSMGATLLAFELAAESHKSSFGESTIFRLFITVSTLPMIAVTLESLLVC